MPMSSKGIELDISPEIDTARPKTSDPCLKCSPKHTLYVIMLILFNPVGVFGQQCHIAQGYQIL